MRRQDSYKKKAIGVVYRVEGALTRNQQNCLDNAFDILFEETLRLRTIGAELDIEPKKGDDSNTN